MKIEDKVKEAIELLKKAERIALKYNENGFYLTFSGGKDSIVIHNLAEEAGVKFEAFYNNTTIDHPSALRFIRENYPSVIWIRPKQTFFQLCRKAKMLPTATARFCCAKLKETNGGGRVVITGVRRAESFKRSKRNSVEISGHKFSGTIDQFNAAFHADEKGTFHSCIKGKDKIIVNPIISWTDSDVWEYIKSRKLAYPDLYDKGYKRLGCLLCPMANKKEKLKMIAEYKNLKPAYLKVIEDIKKLRAGENYGIWNLPAEEIFNWWLEKRPVKKFLADRKQLKLKFDE